MNCNYEFQHNGTSYKGSTIEAVKQAFIEGQLSQNEWILDIFDSELTFYNTHSAEYTQIEKAIEAARNDNAPSDLDNVTKLGESIYSKDKTVEVPMGNGKTQTLPVRDFFLNFRKEFGTYFHSYIETSKKGSREDIEKKRDVLINWMAERAEKFFTEFPEYAQDSSRIINSDLSLANLLINIKRNPDTLERFRNKIEDSVVNLYDKLKSTFGQGALECEVPLYDKDAKLKGRADAIYWTESGDVYIIDFKTSPSTTMSKNSRLNHYLQLELYKRILSKKYNIPSEKIKVKNIQFVYSASGEVNIHTIEDPAEGLNTSSVSTILLSRFPRTAKTLPKAELTKREEKVSKMFSAARSKTVINKTEKEYIQKYLQSKVDNNTELMNHITKHPVSKWKKNGNILIGYDRNGEKILEGTLDEIIAQEQEAISKLKGGSLEDIITILKDKNHDRLVNFLGSHKDSQARHAFAQALSYYLSPQWEYVAIAPLENLGIITMRNSEGYYDFIMPISDAKNLRYSLDPSANLLTNFFKDPTVLQQYKEFKDIPEATLGNVNKLTALMAISQYKDLLEENGEVKIGGIRSVSLLEGQHDVIGNLTPYITCAKLLAAEIKNNADNVYESNVLSDFASNLESCIFINPVTQIYNAVGNLMYVTAANLGDSELGSMWEQKNMTVAKLEEILSYIKNNYKKEDYESTGTEIGRLYMNLSNLILKMRKISPEQMYQVHKRSLTFAESIGAGIDLFRYGDISRFTRIGLRLTGLAQGLETSVSYASPDELNRSFVKVMNAASTQIEQELVLEADELNEATKKYLSNYSQVYTFAIGDHTKAYQDLMEMTSDGKIDRRMLFKNPYAKNNSGLSDSAAEYLEVVLWTINRHRMEHVLSGDIRKLSYKKLKEDKKAFKQYKDAILDDVKYLQIPLKPKGGLSGSFSNIAAFFNKSKGLKQAIKDEVNTWLHYLEPALLNEQQSAQREKDIKDHTYSNYLKEGEKTRYERTESTDPITWEINMNQLALEYAAADYKEIYFTKVLNYVDKAMATISLMEMANGESYQAQRDALENRIKISIYNKALSIHEDEDLLKVVGFTKSVISGVKIAIRPALYLKEMLLGRIRNTSAILTNQIKSTTGNEITMKDLTSAAGVVFGGELLRDESIKLLDGSTFNDFSFVDMLNNIYRINDRDLNVISESLAYDRYGIHNIGSRMLYLNVVNPDWFNRMILFIAAMKADGCFEAHSIDKETGKLVYDISKDSRVSYFWNNRDKNLTTDTKWVQQKAYYQIKMQEFARERELFDDPELSWGQNIDESGKPIYDPFPRAYTSAETDSLKEQIGLIYGYYAHDERANVQKGVWWTLYTQFLTFFPSEIRKYLATGNMESSINTTIHLKDPISGKKLFYQYDEKTGLTKKVEGGSNGISDEGIVLATGQALEPVYDTVNHPLEGLAVSTAKSLRDICTGNATRSWKENPQQWDNAKLFLFNLLIGFLVAALISATVSNFEDSESKAVYTALADVGLKATRELNVYESLIKPVDSFGIIGTDFMKQIGGDLGRTITKDGYSLLNFANDNLSIIKDLHIV